MELLSNFSSIHFTLLAASVVTTLIWLFFRRNHETSRKAFRERNLKFVDAGNMFLDIILKRRIELKKEELIQREGKLWGFNMLNKYTVLMADPELIQQVVSKEFTNFTNRRPINMPDPFFSRVLTLAKDDTWKRLRSVITPTFSAGKLRQMKPCIDETVETLIQNFNDALEKSEIVNVKHVVGAFTMDTVIQIAFGTKLNSLIDPQNPIISHAKRLFSTNFSWENLFSFTTIFLFPKLAKLLGVRVNRVPIDFFTKMALEVIRKKRADLMAKKIENHSKASNFIELLLEAEIESNEEMGNGNSNGKSNNNNTEVNKKYITNDEIIAQCVLFFLVGYDTTASTISMVSYHLALYPEVQERLYEEVIRVVSKLEHESETHETDPVKLVTFESLNRFEYLSAVIKETLRLYAPLVFLERQAAKDLVLQSEDGSTRVDLKKDDIVHIPVYSVHRDPLQFPEPDRFDPERFMTSEPSFHKYAYMPFGNGPRSCVAKSLALLEAKLAVLHMVRNFRLSKCDKTKIPVELYYQSNFIIAKDVTLKVEKRV